MGTTVGRVKGLRTHIGQDSRNYGAGPGPEQIDIILERLHVKLSQIQREVITCPRRLLLVAGGERAGKSYISGLFGASRTPYGSLFWIVGPDYEMARPEFEYWAQHLMKIGAIASDRDISMPKLGKCQMTTKSGQLIETKTSMETKKLAAVAPSGIIMSEAAQHDYDSYLRCVGRVAETRGWLLASGTFEGSSGWYADKFQDWRDPGNLEGGVSYSMPSWSNEMIYPLGREDPEILRLEMIYERIPGLFEERIGAVPVPPHNLVFREFRSTVHVSGNAVFNPDLPVYLAVDPSAGTNPYSVLACQFIKHVRLEPHPDPIDYCNVIDEVYETGLIGEEVIDRTMAKPWWKNVRGGAIDVEAPDERKRWLKRGKVNLKADKIHQLAGIRRLKSFLYYKREQYGEMIEPPHLMINPAVRSLPYEFTKYKREPAKDDDHTPRDRIGNNLPDHSIKALWYLLIARYGEVKGSAIARPINTWKRRR